MLAKLEPFVTERLTATPEQIQAYCKRWKISEMALFGSVLRDDFRPDSDIDFLVTFEPNSAWNLFDHVDMYDEMENMLGRKVDIAERRGLINPYRRRAILRTCQTIYEAN